MPSVEQLRSGFHVTQAIMGDFKETSLGEQRSEIESGDTIALRTLYSEPLAIEIEIEFPE